MIPKVILAVGNHRNAKKRIQFENMIQNICHMDSFHPDRRNYRYHCVLCESYSNSSMKPSHLERHFKSMHPDLKDKPIDYFERLKSEIKGQSKNMEHYTGLELAAIESSLAVAYEIAKAKKPFTVGEKLVQPCLAKVVEIMLGSSAVAKINLVPLSRSTIARRVSEMARDIENQLCSRLKMSGHFALQFDESTDIFGEAILIGFVRYTQSQDRRRYFLYLFVATANYKR